MENFLKSDRNDRIIRTPISMQKAESVIPYQGGYEMHQMIEERLFHIKIREISSELMQIIVAIRELEKFGFGKSKVLDQIYDVLSRIRFGYENKKYIEIIDILAKYLNGMRKFSSTVKIKKVTFYKKLFESTLLAIIQELDSLEEAS